MLLPSLKEDRTECQAGQLAPTLPGSEGTRGPEESHPERYSHDLLQTLEMDERLDQLHSPSWANPVPRETVEGELIGPSLPSSLPTTFAKEMQPRLPPDGPQRPREQGMGDHKFWASQDWENFPFPVLAWARDQCLPEHDGVPAGFFQ